MSQTSGNRKGRRKGKVALTRRVRLVEKNWTSNASRYITAPSMPAQMPRSAGAVFKVKIRRNQ